MRCVEGLTWLGFAEWLVPPRDVDPNQTRIPMLTKARALEKRAG